MQEGELYPGIVSDPAILGGKPIINQTIITTDLGLANVIASPPPHGGIIALRLPNSVQTSDRIRRLLDALASLSGHDLSSVVVVVDQRRVRVGR